MVAILEQGETASSRQPWQPRVEDRSEAARLQRPQLHPRLRREEGEVRRGGGSGRRQNLYR